MLRLAVLFFFAKWAKPLDLPNKSAAAEDAWKIHQSIVDWTGKVDQKASFALAFQSAIVAAVLALSTGEGALSKLSGWEEALPYWLGIVCLAAAILFAVAVVKPSLRARKIESEAASNYIFFGHLRKWEPADLQRALERNEILPVLSRQLVVTSGIAWRKHRRLQLSLWLAVVGTGAICLSSAVDHHLFCRTWDALRDLFD